MTSEEVEKLIKSEVGDKLDTTNMHGINLTLCLVKPVRQKYISALDNSQTFDLWTVLIESEDGYRIFYDEDENTFGLATKSKNNELMYLGNYGTFLETLAGM
jgi:hypothetical protein